MIMEMTWNSKDGPNMTYSSWGNEIGVPYTIITNPNTDIREWDSDSD